MDRSNSLKDDTLRRLNSLTDVLKAHLEEAEDVRARFTKAHEADAWPDLRAATQVLVNANRREP